MSEKHHCRQCMGSCELIGAAYHRGLSDAATPPTEQWVCFHCNTVLTGRAEAEAHFGVGRSIVNMLPYLHQGAGEPECQKHKAPTSPSDAAMRAAADIARLIQDEYEHGAASVEPEIAAIITRNLAAGAGTWATIKQTCGFCGQRVEYVCTAFLKGAAATTTPEKTPNYALVQLLNAAMLHPEQAEGYIRRVIAELGDASPRHG